MDNVEINYISHNGTGLPKKDIIGYIPQIGSIIVNDELKDRSCTGRFVVVDVIHTKINNDFNCLIECIEISDEDDLRSRLKESGHL